MCNYFTLKAADVSLKALSQWQSPFSCLRLEFILFIPPGFLLLFSATFHHHFLFFFNPWRKKNLVLKFVFSKSCFTHEKTKMTFSILFFYYFTTCKFLLDMQLRQSLLDQSWTKPCCFSCLFLLTEGKIRAMMDTFRAIRSISHRLFTLFLFHQQSSNRN